MTSPQKGLKTAPPRGCAWTWDRDRVDPQLDASILIPTYNRAPSLERTLRSLEQLDYPRERYEIIVIDNNSTDSTSDVVDRFSRGPASVRRIEEKRLSFTAARHAGATEARSPVLAYIDDDVIVDERWLAATVDVFRSDARIGMVAGRIEPSFEEEPPPWAVAAQAKFNGWSLWRPSATRTATIGACGPSLAVRADVLAEVGGFPPDTIGVEAEGRESTVEKIYVGPGDWGLNVAVLNAGYRIVYDPDVLVHHVIPPVRMTRDWWFSRLVGEGYMRAITFQRWHDDGRPGALRRALTSLFACGGSLAKMLIRGSRTRAAYRFDLARNWTEAKVSFALSRHPEVVDPLWEAGITGVPTADIHDIVRLLP